MPINIHQQCLNPSWIHNNVFMQNSNWFHRLIPFLYSVSFLCIVSTLIWRSAVTIELSGILCAIIHPAPITQLLPMQAPLSITALLPNQHRFPMKMGAVEYPCSLILCPASANLWLWSYIFTFSPKIQPSPISILSNAFKEQP